MVKLTFLILAILFSVISVTVANAGGGIQQLQRERPLEQFNDYKPQYSKVPAKTLICNQPAVLYAADNALRRGQVETYMNFVNAGLCGIFRVPAIGIIHYRSSERKGADMVYFEVIKLEINNIKLDPPFPITGWVYEDKLISE